MNRLFVLLFVSFFLITACRDQSAESLYQQGLEFSSSGNYQASVTLFKDALVKDPNLVPARYQLSLAYLETGKLDKSESELEKIQLQDPQHRDALLLLARIYNSSDRPDKTISILSHLEKTQQLDASTCVLLGQSYTLKEDIPSAERYFRDALQMSPDSVSAKLGLARVYFASDRISEGNTFLEEIIQADANNTAPYYLYFQEALRSADQEKALDALQQITKRDPNDIGALYTMGMLLLDIDRLDDGKAVALDLKTRFPGHPSGSRVDGVYFYATGSYEKAVSELQKSNQGFPDLPGYYFLGLSYYNLSQFEQALSSFQKALDLQPSHHQSRLMVAQTLLKQGRIDDAIIEVRRALDKDKQNGLAYNILGSAYLAQGQYDLAMENLDKAIELNPALAGAHFKKGLFNLSRGNMDKAEADLSKAVNAAPEVLNARLLLTSFFIQQQNFPKAIATLQQGLNGLPDDALLYNYQAAAFFAQGKQKEALESLNKAKKIKPDYFTPYFNLANYYLSVSDAKKAHAEYQGVLNIAPDNLTALLKEAVLFELDGELKQAEFYFQRAGATNNPQGHLAYVGYLVRTGDQKKSQDVLTAAYMAYPTDANILIALGKSLQAQKKYDDATKIFLELVTVAPEQGLPLLIAIHLEKGDVAAAMEVADQAVALRPEHEYGYLLLSAVHEFNKDYQRARDVLQQGISRIKNPLRLSMQFGQTFANQGEQKKALQIYEDLLTTNPGYVPAIFAVATFHDAAGDKRKAQSLYKEVLERNENFAPALNNLAYLYADVYENYEEALKLATRAFRSKPDDPYIMDTLGFVLLKNGKAEQAVSLLEKSSRMLPRSIPVQLHLSQAYLATGRSENAESYLNAIVKSGNEAEVKQAKTLLKKM